MGVRTGNPAWVDSTDAADAAANPSRKITAAKLNAIEAAIDDSATSGHAHDARYVRTVNLVGPDSNGNVTVSGGGGSVAWADITGKPTNFPPETHEHAAGDITSGTLAAARLGSGTADSGTVLHGDGTWKPAPSGGGASTLDDLTDVDTSGQTTGDVLKYNGTSWVADAASAGTVTSTDISDSTATGRAVLTAADAATARGAIGAGTSDFDGAYSSLSGRPTLGTAAAADTGDFAPALGADDNYVTDAEKAALHGHSNKAALDNVSGVNTGDQDLSGYATTASLATVATSGAYGDLTGKPTLGTAAATAATDYATAAQGAKADSALQVASAQPINAQTAAYTLAASDAGKMVTLTLAAAADLTVPANVFSAGQRVDIADRGAARVTVRAGSGMTVNPPAGGSLVMEGQYAYASLVFLSATEADLVGLVAAS